MILISHPRSGSDWFLTGLTDYVHARTEILSPLNELESQNSSFKGTSFAAKLTYLKLMRPSQVQKIHSAHLRWAAETEPRATELFKILNGRTDLYFLKRKNVQKAIVSGFIAAVNDSNYHGDPQLLTKPAKMTYTSFWRQYQINHVDTLWAEQAFTYVEKFTFEDLLSGGVKPHTLSFNPMKSTSIKRDTYKLRHLITNFDEMVKWMKDLQVPGHLADE